MLKKAGINKKILQTITILLLQVFLSTNLTWAGNINLAPKIDLPTDNLQAAFQNLISNVNASVNIQQSASIYKNEIERLLNGERKNEAQINNIIRQFPDNPMLEIMRYFIIDVITNPEGERKIILYHNEYHIELDLLDFIDKIKNFLPWRRKTQGVALTIAGALTHDAGYFTKSESVRKGHVKKSIQLLKEFLKSIEKRFNIKLLSDLELEAVVYRISMTELMPPERVKEFDRKNDRYTKAYDLMEKLNQGERLDVNQKKLLIGFLKKYFPSANQGQILEEKESIDRDIVMDAILGGEVLAAADIHGQGKKYPERVGNGLHPEFMEDRIRGDDTSPAADTRFEQIGGSPGFHEFYAEPTKLDKLTLVNKYMPESLREERQQMKERTKKIDESIAVLKSGNYSEGSAEFTAATKLLEDFLNGLNNSPDFNQDLMVEYREELQSFIDHGLKHHEEITLAEAIMKSEVGQFLTEKEILPYIQSGQIKEEDISLQADGQGKLVETTILREGTEDGNGAYIILSGQVKVTKEAWMGWRTLTLEQGDIFGEIMPDKERTATVKTAGTSVKLARIPPEVLKELYESNGGVKKYINQKIAQRIIAGDNIHREMLSFFGKSRISHLPNRDKYGEELVKSLKTGNKTQVAFLSIQDFRQFNDRGAALDELAKKHPLDKVSIFGHEFGDWVIELTAVALEEYLPRAIDNLMSRYARELSKAARPRFKVYNDAKSYWIIFENLSEFIKASDILKELLKENSDFRNSMVAKVKALAVKRINQRLKSKEIDKSTAGKLKEALEDFTSRQFNMYGGISEVISLQETTLGLTPVQAAHRLDSQAQFSAKAAQINFDRNRLHELLEKRAISILRKEIKAHVDAARIAQESRLREYDEELAEDVDLHKKYGERGEWESMYRPITAVYDETTTHERLLNEFYRALAGGDERDIEKTREDIFKKIGLYYLESSIADRAKRNVFFGNERFKDTINYIIQKQPGFSWSGTFKIGGDEIGKVVWDADKKRLDVFRFDINNLGKINIQLGVRLGDKIIDEMIRLIDEVEDAHEYMRFVYNYFLNNNVPGANLRDNPLEIAKEDYDYIAERLQEKGKSPEDYFKIENDKYFLEKFPPVVVQEINDEIGALINEYESSAAVSAGMMSIDVNLINEQKEKGENTNVDFSGMASGRADRAAELVKAEIKRSQGQNSGIISEDTFKILDGTGEVSSVSEKNSISLLDLNLDLSLRNRRQAAIYQKLYGLQQAVSYEKRALPTLPAMELSPARSVLAEFIVNLGITPEDIIGDAVLENVNISIDATTSGFVQQAI